jgi:hypothetical protein
MLHLILAFAFNIQGPTFQKTTTYQACHQTTVFACGMMRGNQRYGTAHERKVCERYEFHPDGTFTSSGAALSGREGTYVIFAGKVQITPDDAKPFELTLSPDGMLLGGLKRLPSSR